MKIFGLMLELIAWLVGIILLVAVWISKRLFYWVQSRASVPAKPPQQTPREVQPRAAPWQPVHRAPPTSPQPSHTPVQVTVIDNIPAPSQPTQPRVGRPPVNPLEDRICLTTGSHMMEVHPFADELEDQVQRAGAIRMAAAFDDYHLIPEAPFQLAPPAPEEPPLPEDAVIALPAEDGAMWVATTTTITKSPSAESQP